MNKRGDEALLPEETLKIIIAVICIAGLIILIVLVYFAVTGDQNTKKAQAVVSRVANETKRINAEEIDDVTPSIPNPKGWYVFSFVGQDMKPNSCAGANCLCVCEKLSVPFINVDSRQAQRCDDKGACVVIVNLKKFNPIKIEGGGIFISIKKVNGLIEIT